MDLKDHIIENKDSISYASTKAAQTDTTTASNAVKSNANAEEFDSQTKIGSMNQLKEEAPKLYKMIMESLARSICNRMKEQQDHIREISRQYRER